MQTFTDEPAHHNCTLIFLWPMTCFASMSRHISCLSEISRTCHAASYSFFPLLWQSTVFWRAGAWSLRAQSENDKKNCVDFLGDLWWICNWLKKLPFFFKLATLSQQSLGKCITYLMSILGYEKMRKNRTLVGCVTWWLHVTMSYKKRWA